MGFVCHSLKKNPAVVQCVDITTNIAAGDQLEIATLTNKSRSPHNSILVAFIAVLTCWSSTSSINQPDAPQLQQLLKRSGKSH